MRAVASTLAATILTVSCFAFAENKIPADFAKPPPKTLCQKWLTIGHTFWDKFNEPATQRLARLAYHQSTGTSLSRQLKMAPDYHPVFVERTATMALSDATHKLQFRVVGKGDDTSVQVYSTDPVFGSRRPIDTVKAKAYGLKFLIDNVDPTPEDVKRLTLLTSNVLTHEAHHRRTIIVEQLQAKKDIVKFKTIVPFWTFLNVPGFVMTFNSSKAAAEVRAFAVVYSTSVEFILVKPEIIGGKIRGKYFRTIFTHDQISAFIAGTEIPTFAGSHVFGGWVPKLGCNAELCRRNWSR